MTASIDTRLATLRLAADRCRAVPGRRGRLLLLQDADEVLAAGDMHGHVENFRQAMLRADLARHPRRHLVLQELIHGPFRYPDGSDRSHQLVDLACALIGQFPGRVHYLPGNHELAQLTGRRIGKEADLDLNDQFSAGVRTAYGSRADEVMAAYHDLWRAAPLAIRTEGGLFLSHSLPSAGMQEAWELAMLERDPTPDADLQPGGPAYALVWGRDLRPEASDSFLARCGASALVTGHVPVEGGWRLASERHLVLDTQGHPAAVALLPAGRALLPGELAGGVKLL
ncbi:MAG: metallophosphoesterase [Gemmataceae bacterium]|nr:metallophosphoesterase [Gemmataceae bacterium]